MLSADDGALIPAPSLLSKTSTREVASDETDALPGEGTVTVEALVGLLGPRHASRVRPGTKALARLPVCRRARVWSRRCRSGYPPGLREAVIAGDTKLDATGGS